MNYIRDSYRVYIVGGKHTDIPVVYTSWWNGNNNYSNRITISDSIPEIQHEHSSKLVA